MQVKLKKLHLIGVFAAFSLMTACLFYPCFTQFNSAIIGPPEDNTQFLWFLWYGSRAIFDPTLNFFHTTLMYHPEGMELWYANYFYIGVVWTALIKPLAGLAASYNLVVLLSFAASGLSAYVLIKYLTDDAVASFYGAFVYAFSPFHFGHALHHPSVASIQFLPLFLLFVIRAHRHGRWSDRIAAAVMLALAGYCEWNYLIYGGICMALAYPWTAWRERKIISLRALLNVLTVGGGAFLLTSPVLVPMVLLGLKHPDAPYLPGHNIFVADLFGFFIPPAFHPLGTADWIRQIRGPMTGPAWESAVYLGWVNLILVGAAIVKAGKKVTPYLIAFGIIVILAMGVELHVRGALTGIRLPYSVFEALPFLKHARNPSRVMAFGYLFWSILTALGVHALFRSPSSKIRHPLLLVLVAGLGFMDFYALASDVTPVKLPPVYEAVTRDPEYADRGFAIMNIPWDKGRYMMEQTIHGLPDLQGYLGRKFSIPLIGKLPFEDLQLQKKILDQHRVKYILVRKKRMQWDPNQPEEVRVYGSITQLARLYARVYTKVYEDDSDALFKVY